MAQTHQTLAASLTPEQSRVLQARSDRAGLLHLAGHGGAVVLVAALILSHAPWWPVLLLVQGILVIFLFTTLHETIHRTAFKSGALNQGVAAVCGLLVFVPPGWFRHFHFAHHRFTNDPANDPELATEKPQTPAQYLAYISGLPVWWSQFRALVVNGAGGNADPFVAEKDRAGVAAEARAYLTVYGLLAVASIMAESYALVWVWLVPVLLGQPFLRAYLLAEHWDCPQVQNMLENSRTTQTNALVRFITWNMPYHIEHHVMPAVPFHKLAALQRYTAADSVVVAQGFIRLHARIIASLMRGRRRPTESHR